jgi:putative SOS response-associated peptidase YedK
LENRAHTISSHHSTEKHSPKRSFDSVRWGLIPSWAKDASIATKTINAMSETAADRPAFRDALRLRRCLIPTDAFYEWQSKGPKQKLPFSICMADDSLAFAGLWESWVDPNNNVVESCTILTTTPNALSPPHACHFEARRLPAFPGPEYQEPLSLLAIL